MIRTFLDFETERVWQGEPSRKLPPDIPETARRKLRQLNGVSAPSELRFPNGNWFEESKGSRKGIYSVRINRQWRLCFTWADGGAENVRIEDYHE